MLIKKERYFKNIIIFSITFLFLFSSMSLFAQTLQILSPNGAEFWAMDTLQTITWNSSNLSGDVNIDISLDTGNSWLPIAPSVPDSGSYFWIPNFDLISDSCLIKISSVLNSSVYDFSDSFFSILLKGDVNFDKIIDTRDVELILQIILLTLTPTPKQFFSADCNSDSAINSLDLQYINMLCIRVNSPKGGDIWVAGSSDSVKWKPSALSNNVKIEISINNGNLWTTIAPNIPDTGLYIWTPTIEYISDSCLIRITKHSRSYIVGQTDSFFSIVRPPNLPPDSVLLINPLTNSFVNSSFPTLSWQIPFDPDGDSLHFKVELDNDGTFGANTLIFESSKDTTGFNPTHPVQEGQGNASYTMQTALSEGEWWWRVLAWDGQIYSPPSEAWSFTINLPPNPPQNLFAVPGNRQITLSWSPNTEPDMSYYVVYRSQHSVVKPSSTDSVASVNHPNSTYSDSSLTNGLTYYYRISAVDTFNNESGFSEEVGATPLSPVIHIDSTQHYFGDILVDSSKIWVLKINNIGNEKLLIIDINWKESVFSVSDTSGSIIPNDSFKVTITFIPDTARAYSDTLTIFSNDPVDSILHVVLTGNGINPLEPKIAPSDMSHDFGEVLVDNSKSWILTINNVGSDTLIINDINWKESVFSVSDTSSSILSQESLKVTITFRPKAAQDYQDSLTIFSNDPDESIVKIVLIGQGIFPIYKTISVLPNPFTPNNDGYNDYVEFKYPEMYDQEPIIQIYNLRGRKIRELKDFSGYECRWYGKDDNGRELEPGVYIYILEVQGNKISNGTITLIR